MDFSPCSSPIPNTPPSPPLIHAVSPPSSIPPRSPPSSPILSATQGSNDNPGEDSHSTSSFGSDQNSQDSPSDLSEEEKIVKKRRTWETYAVNIQGVKVPSRSTAYKLMHCDSQHRMGNEASLSDTPPVHTANTGQGPTLGCNIVHQDSNPFSTDPTLSRNSSIIDLSPTSNLNVASSHTSEQPVYEENLSRNPVICGSQIDSDSSSDNEYYSSSECSVSPVRSEESEGENEDEFVEESTVPGTRSNSNEDETSEDDFEEDIHEISKKLYEGCNLSVGEAVLDMLQNHVQNKDTKKSLSDNLRMFLKYLPKPNYMPQTVYRLVKYVSDLGPNYTETEHLYCSKCCSLVHKTDDMCCIICNCSELKKFYSFSVESQLRHYLEKFKLYQYFQRSYNNGGNVIRDINDGTEYKRVYDGGEFSITLMLSTDGVSVSNSSKTSLYPLQYVICELPPHLRSSYTVVCAIWCDSVKPAMNIFLRPLVDELQALTDKGGLGWVHPEREVEIKSSVHAPLICGDAPIRAQIQNIVSHNGKYSCNSCEQKTVKLPLTAAEIRQKAAGKNVRRKRAFKYQEEPARLRKGSRMLRQADQAVRGGKAVKGVKGPAVVSLLPSLNLATCVFGEYMHLICLGIVKMSLNIWLTVPGPWNISCHKRQVDEFLENISPPSFVGRLPRGVTQFKQWKASEFRAWLLYYSLPALQGVLPRQFLQHWILFVVAVYTLLQESITMTEIDLAEVLIKLFLRDVGTLYGDQYYTYNMHEILHIPLYVRRWGPMWATSAFPFESFYGVLSSFIHGTKNKAKELTNALRLTHGLEILRLKVLSQNEAEHRNEQECLFKLLNQCQFSCLSDFVVNFLARNGVSQPFAVFARAQGPYNEIFTSKLYQREKKRNNFTVSFQKQITLDKMYGEIYCFVQKSCDTYCLINVLRINHTSIFYHEASRLKVEFIVPVLRSDDFQIVPLASIIRKVIRVGNFVCSPPNSFEKNTL